MTDDLIARLRMYEPQYLNRESADALEAQARRIAELEALIADLRDALNCEIKAKFYHKKAWQDEFMAHRATNDKQAARIAALEAENKRLGILHENYKAAVARAAYRGEKE